MTYKGTTVEMVTSSGNLYSTRYCCIRKQRQLTINNALSQARTVKNEDITGRVKVNWI